MAEKFVIGSFSFDTKSEYEKAVAEKKMIADLVRKVNLNNGKDVVTLYNHLVENGKFTTVVGIEYLYKLRTMIIKKKFALPEELPLIGATSLKNSKVDSYFLKKAENTIDDMENIRKKDREKLKTSIILNCVLVAVIAVMMYIASTSDNVNISNYETKIRNKYSAWEQELTEREAAVRQQELNLGEK